MIWGLEQFMIKQPSFCIATSISLREDIKQTMELYDMAVQLQVLKRLQRTYLWDTL